VKEVSHSFGSNLLLEHKSCHKTTILRKLESSTSLNRVWPEKRKFKSLKKLLKAAIKQQS